MEITATEQVLSILDSGMAEALAKYDAFGGETADQRRIDTRNWLIKKADIHPKLVWKAMQMLADCEEIKVQLSTLNVKSVTLDAVALLHDLGRLREVNPETATIELFQDYTDYSHSKVSYDILRQQGLEDWEILLPIKYHDRYAFDAGLAKDENFLNLSEEAQQRTKLIWNLIIDTDRLGNMAYQSLHGIAGTLEALSPKYHSEALISPEMKRMILEGHIFTSKDIQFEKTHADVLGRFMAGSNMLRFEASKKVFKEAYLDGLYAHLRQELQKAPGNEVSRTKALKDAEDIYNYFKCVQNKIN